MSNTDPISRRTPAPPVLPSPRRLTGQSRCCRIHPTRSTKDFATARSHLAGDFLSYYDQFTQQIVAPAAKQKSLKTTAKVVRAAVSELHPDSAVVLVFVDQSTTSKDSPNPSMAASSVMVTLAKVDGNWLITKFTPV